MHTNVIRHVLSTTIVELCSTRSKCDQIEIQLVNDIASVIFLMLYFIEMNIIL